MTKEKQIEEMADDVRRIRESYFGQADYLFAMKLYEDGYRKQSEGEWIPNQGGGFLCGNCKKYSTGLKLFCSFCGAKMKGGE